VDEDVALFAWLRHYGALIILFFLVGGAAGFVYTRIVPRRAQAWTLVVETGTGIGPRQLGPVGQALFHASEVYRPAMQRLGIGGSPIQFLGHDVSLQPVPSTNTLIVVGTARDLTRAERISSVMTNSFVQALKSRGFEHFHIFGATQPAPVRSGISTKVAVVVGAVAARWLGLAVTIGHYRMRRPVLSVETAAAVAGAERVVEVDGSRPAWLGVLRGHPAWKESSHNHVVLDRFVADTARATFVAPQMDVRRRERLAALLGYALGNGSDADPRDGGEARFAEALRISSQPTVLLCDPGTRESDLVLLRRADEATGTRSSVELLWIR